MKNVGVNFSDTSIEAVELEQGWLNAPSFTAYSRVLLPDGCIENGIILKSATVIEQLRKLLVQAQPQAIKGQSVTLSLPEGQVFSRLLSFPKASSAEQIEQTIVDQLSRFIPFEPNEIVFDTMPMGTRGDKCDVLLVAVQKKVVKEYEAVATQLGWTLKSIELESISSARAVLAKIPAKAAVLLLDIGARTTIASWFDATGLRYSYNIAIAGNYFTNQLVKQLHCTPLEAEQRKQAEGLSGPVEKILTTAFMPILTQVREGLAYVQSNYGLPTTAVRLLGGSAQLPHLADFLSDQLQIETTLATLLPSVKKNGIIQQLQKEGIIYYNAVGLALGSSKNYQQRPAINFYKKH